MKTLAKSVVGVLLFLVLASANIFAQSFSATASWNAVTTSVTGSPMTGVTYNLYRATSSAGAGEVKLNVNPIASTTFLDTTGNVTVTYFYRVSGVSSSGVEGAKSGFVQFTFGTNVPVSPTGLSVTSP